MLNQYKVIFISAFLLNSIVYFDASACQVSRRKINISKKDLHKNVFGSSRKLDGKNSKLSSQQEIRGKQPVQESIQEEIETEKAEEALPLTPEEQAQKDKKRAAKGGAYGGLASAVAWEAGTWYVNNALAAGTSFACPPFGTVVCAGIAIGALYGYATSE